MRLEGRTERRVVRAVPVYLVITQGLLGAEYAITVNVSPHGARLTTKRQWKPGEQARFATQSGEFHVEASVVYCEPLPDGRFCVGLEIPGVMDWGDEVSRKSHPAAERVSGVK